MPGSPPSDFGHHSSSPGRAGPSDGHQFQRKPSHLDADVQGMLSRLRRISSQQSAHQPPPKPGSRGDGMQMRHPVPGTARQRSPSPPPHSMTERDRHPPRPRFTAPSGFGSPDRHQPWESEEHTFAARGNKSREKLEEDDLRWRLSGAHRGIRPPPPMRFQPDLPRHYLNPRLCGMQPQSLLSLDIQPSPSLQHRQSDPSRKDPSRPPASLRDDDDDDDDYDDQDFSSHNEDIHDQFSADRMDRDHRPPLQLRQDIERPPVQMEIQRSVFLQDRSRSPHDREELKPPDQLESFRYPQQPNARQPFLPQTQSFRLPHADDKSPPPHQPPNIPSQPKPNFPVPPFGLKDGASKSSRMHEDRFTSQGQMMQGPSLHLEQEMQNYCVLPTPADMPHHRSREMQQDVGEGRGLSGPGSSASMEGIHRPAQPRKAGPPSLMDLNIQQPPLRPPVRPALPRSGSREALMDARGIPDPNIDPKLGLGLHFATQQVSDRSPVVDSHTDSHHASNYQVGMSDEPLQFTGRMPVPPRSVNSSFQHIPSPHLSHAGIRSPLSSGATFPHSVSNQSSGAGNYTVGMSDKPLQFANRMPAPRMQDTSLQPVPMSSLHPVPAAQSADDKRQAQDTGSHLVGLSSEPLRLPVSSAAGPSIQSFHQQQQQHVPGMLPPSAVDSPRTQAVGMSDEPLQFTGRITAAPWMPDSLSYRLPQPDSSVHSFPSTQSSVSAPGHTLAAPLHPPHGMPPPSLPPGMPPPFIGMPQRPLLPPHIGSGPPMGLHPLPAPGGKMGVAARPPQPFPGNASGLHPPAGSLPALPGSEMLHPFPGPVANPMLPQPPLRPPFFPPMLNMVSYEHFCDI